MVVTFGGTLVQSSSVTYVVRGIFPYSTVWAEWQELQGQYKDAETHPLPSFVNHSAQTA